MKGRQFWKRGRYQKKGYSREARAVFNIKVEYRYLNPDYEFPPLQDNEITEQGLLLCGKLKPQQPLLPEFWIRWDEKGDHLNVDIKPDEGCKDDWEKETNGYKGHLPQKASDCLGKAFNLLITTPDLKVFDGVISFNLARDVKATVSIGVHASADVQDVKG